VCDVLDLVLAITPEPLIVPRHVAPRNNDIRLITLHAKGEHSSAAKARREAAAALPILGFLDTAVFGLVLVAWNAPFATIANLTSS
jgi:hypothetical protein